MYIIKISNKELDLSEVKDQCGKNNVYYKIGRMNYNKGIFDIELEFEFEEDALAFKLRW